MGSAKDAAAISNHECFINPTGLDGQLFLPEFGCSSLGLGESS